ncbi:Z1 domain-containing protein [Desulfovibrio sp. JC022]|uniref:Z1 domain-containing protein n=1 Tax=Desulfovibrio sp. JC022 TaxID=2593642 RepID=UPI0013D5BEAE|nr:Z1 domain-containing protein [Desulfovibrio sp. JC022]NDV24326.1 endonuclease [Desulfovibrio sp. JC022]
MNNAINDIQKDIEIYATQLLSRLVAQEKEITKDQFNLAVKNAISGTAALNPEDEIEKIDVDIIVNKLQEKFDIQMTLGTIFPGDKYTPWLEQKYGDIDWYYWGRYRQLLLQDGFPPQVVRSLGSVTDQVIDHLENPQKEGSWDRRGMVVGHVQSGKTANYTGVICKAADCGYKVIIVLAGMLNALRNQTQERIDSGFIGRCTRLNEWIGAGLISKERIPTYFTTSTDDFSKQVSKVGVGIDGLREPAVLVLKKNSNTLSNLIDWLENNNPHKLQSYPMLLIDDEADHASINTKTDGITAINGKIRQLLSLFKQSSYVGYTATPFANIFIDPDTNDEMINENLFPRDFILSLDAPDNYVGPERVFSKNTDLKMICEVDDYSTILPLTHKIDREIEELPPSLNEAIVCFVLARAIRLSRGQTTVHNSMMINVSRFTNIQSKVKLLVDEYIKEELRPAIKNHSKLPPEQALQNSTLEAIYNTWEKHFHDMNFEWSAVQNLLEQAIGPVGVIEVNGSSTAEPLNYSREDYPNGRNVIAVGGLGLSRGLTLEGLTVSYFLRNSIMYDTLLQMGRWFGYRDNYADVCRLFMSKEAKGWYAHISKATEELRIEFLKMKNARMTPSDFGLCVRAHPESLIVTARNKMRSGKRVPRKIGLEGRLVETKSLSSKKEVVARNLLSLDGIITKIQNNENSTQHHGQTYYLWKDVAWEIIESFLNSFINTPSSDLTESLPLKDHGSWLAATGYSNWDVLLMTPKDGKSKIKKNIETIKINAQIRTVKEETESSIKFPNRRVASGSIEKIGLDANQEGKALSLAKNKKLSDTVYREARDKPLLMLHLLDCQLEENSPLFKEGILGWGMSFPGSPGSKRPKKLVEYVVNTVWWDNEYGELIEDEDIIDE